MIYKMGRTEHKNLINLPHIAIIAKIYGPFTKKKLAKIYSGNKLEKLIKK